MAIQPSRMRAELLTMQKYCRKVNGLLETRGQMFQRVISHQRWLWQRQLNRELNQTEESELDTLFDIFMSDKGSPAGRTKFLGGTEKSREFEMTQFNCAGLKLTNVNSLVDAYHGLLQGCGVSILPQRGNLFGFSKRIEQIEVVRSIRIEKGLPNNVETFADGVWTIKVGDSAVAWAKAVGKLIAHIFNGENIRAKKLVLDFSEIRGKGQITRGYGWRTSGDEKLADAMLKIANILNNRVQQSLSVIDMLDVFNLLGETLSSRRSAELILLSNNHPEASQFVSAKKDFWKNGNNHRRQANLTLGFETKPTLNTLREFFHTMVENGGSEPGLCNLTAWYHRLAEFLIMNPCAEAGLVDMGLCNLSSINTTIGSLVELMDIAYYIGRMTYRQTLVDLRDGVLSEQWHRNNQHYRFCGVSLNGIVESGLIPAQLRRLRQSAVHGALSMARELGLSDPYYVTTVKPSGTEAKCLGNGVSEGNHHPLAKHIFNWVNFSGDDPIINSLESYGYRVRPNPANPSDVLVCFPVNWNSNNFKWKQLSNGLLVDSESAVSQLNRYRNVMQSWCDTNVSQTIYYEENETDSIAQWVYENWDSYVSTAFMLRYDPAKIEPGTYLPQTPVTEGEYNSYVAKLKDVDLEGITSEFNRESSVDACESGQCGMF